MAMHPAVCQGWGWRPEYWFWTPRAPRAHRRIAFLIDGQVFYTLRFTDMGVRKKDGPLHHRVGIKPTVPVGRTLAGVIAGRDELLEKGIEVVSHPKSPILTECSRSAAQVCRGPASHSPTPLTGALLRAQLPLCLRRGLLELASARALP